jgi:hypothetical protein
MQAGQRLVIGVSHPAWAGTRAVSQRPEDGVLCSASGLRVRFPGQARRTRNDERGRAVRDPVLGRGVGAALIFLGPVLPALLVGVILI